MGLLLYLLSWFFRLLPLRLALGIGRGLAWLWFYGIPLRRRVALDNVARALGEGVTSSERRRIVRRCFEHLVMMGIESLRMPGLTEEDARRLLRKERFEPFWEALEQGKGVIVFMAHLGNYEMLAACSGLTGEPVNAVVREFKVAAVERFVARTRARTNYRTIPPRRSKDQIKETLARGEAVVFLIDQHMPAHRGIVCSFFGQLASTSPAPTRFAVDTGAPTFGLEVMRDPERPGHHIARFTPELALETPYDDPADNLWHNTERINRIVEDWIRARPDQWLWLHRRWKVHDAPEGWEIRPEVRESVGR